MRGYAITTALWVLVGCGGEAMPADGGQRPDAGPPDGGSVDVCTRDRDCADGLFCNGEERCRPGEPGADARGCLAIPPPCGPEACDEATARCEACELGSRDRDMDGFVSTACGGMDCNDDDPTIHPGATEICDALGIDEDCDPSTWGPDRDSDGHVATACCYQPAGGDLQCGLDCNDDDAAIGPYAPERCNGLDDDCDGLIDEDFECLQSELATGTNACGREGTRRCGATCTWLDAAFTRAESASTCDYCDDSGAGLGEEVPYASVTIEQEAVTSGWAAYGSARLSGPTWTLANGSNERGSTYLPTAIQVGYLPLTITANVRSTANTSEGCSSVGGVPFCNGLGGRWDIVVLHAPAVAFLAVDGLHAPLPVTERGIAVTWEYSHTYPFGTGTRTTPDDRISIRELTGSGLRTVASTIPPAIAQQSGPAGASTTHLLFVRLVPDDPRTLDDESALEVSAVGIDVSCANNSATPCGTTFRAGESVHVGLMAATNGANDVSTDQPRLAYTVRGRCGP